MTIRAISMHLKLQSTLKITPSPKTGKPNAGIFPAAVCRFQTGFFPQNGRDNNLARDVGKTSPHVTTTNPKTQLCEAWVCLLKNCDIRVAVFYLQEN